MSGFGECFSDDYVEEFAKRNITPGSVIKAFVNNTNPPKEKRFVILGIDDIGNLIGAVFINSEINPALKRNPDLFSLQHLVKKEQNEFLDWDSYIDCSQLQTIDYSYVKGTIMNDTSRVLGEVSNNDLDIITSLVITSPTATPKQLKKFKLI